MSYFAVRDLSLVLRQFRLRDISLTLERGQMLVLLGPSGAGKSMLLETIAGFNRPSSGSVHLDGREITALPPEECQLGFMFQDYALFPHLNVEQNVAFGVRRARNARQRVREALDVAGIRHLAARRPATLSGGERQRVALARAIATRPRLFLFDEPLSALDAITREQLRDELRMLLRSIEATSLYVTHDRTEALMLADVLAVMHEGQIRQVGDPEQLFSQPVDAWVARFLGLQVVRPERVCRRSDGRATVVIGGAIFEADAGDVDPETALVAFRPEDLRLERRDGAPATLGGFPARVAGIVPLGALVRVDLDGCVLCSALLARDRQREIQLRPGDEVLASIAAEDLRLVPPGVELGGASSTSMPSESR